MRRAAVLVFLIALGVRVVMVFGFHHYEWATSEHMAIARNLASRGAFADPYALPTGATAHAAPLYPAACALIYAAFGDTPRAERARYIFNAVGAALGYALLPAVSQALGLGWIAGAAAGLFGALVPLHYWAECVTDFEGAWTGAFLECAVLWFMRLVRSGAAGLRSALGSGAFWGGGMLLAPTVALPLAGFLGLATWKRKINLRWAAVLAATMLAVLSPWMIRNWVRLGGLVVVRDDLGLELSVSNNDDATPLFDRNWQLPYWITRHPHRGVAPAQEIRRVGELEFERRKLRQARDWIETHPRRFAELTAGRVFYFWFPRVPKYQWAQRGVTTLAAIGWLLLFRDRRFAAIVLATVMAACSAPFWSIQVTLRYQQPIWWALLLLAAWPVARLIAPPQKAEADV